MCISVKATWFSKEKYIVSSNKENNVPVIKHTIKCPAITKFNQLFPYKCTARPGHFMNNS